MSAVMAQTGASFEESLGMLTAITEVTRSANKASRGLVSIGSRLVQVVDESSSTGKALKQIYEDLGIALFDSEGQLRSSYDIFSDLAEIWDTLDTNTQNYIASTQAGTNQFQNFAALMQNFAHATEATETAINSAGSAAEENARYMESLEAKTQQLSATFQNLANNVIDSQLVKSILSLANAFLTLLNTPIGTFITQVALLTGVLSGLSSIIQAEFSTKIIGQFKIFFSTLIGNMRGVGVAGTAGAAGISAMGTAMKAALPTSLAISLAIAGIATVVKLVADAVDEAIVTLEEQKEIVSGLTEELNSTQSEIDELNSKMAQGTSTQADEARLKILEAQLAVTQAQYDLEMKRQVEMDTSTVGEGAVAQGNAEVNAFNNYVNSLTYYQQKLEDLGPITEKNADQAQDFIDKIEELQSAMLDNLSTMGEYVATLEEYKAAGYDIGEAGQEFIDTYYGLVDSVDQYGISIETASDASSNLASGLSDTADSAEEIQSMFDELSNSIDSLKETYDTLSNAVTEYNENGSLSLDTITELLALDYDYLNALELQNGKLVLNTETLYARANQLKEQAKQELTAKTMTELNSIATQDLAGSFDMAGTAATDNQEAFSGLAGILTQVASGSISAGAAINYLWSSLEPESTGYRTFSEEAKTAMNETLETYRTLMGEIDASVIDFTPGGTGDGTSTTTDPLKERKEIIDDTIDAMEHEIFLMEKQGATASEIAAKYEEMQAYLHSQAEWYRQQGEDENSEYIRALQESWWEYEDSITEAYRDAFDERLQISEDYIDDRNDLDDWGADNEVAAWQRVLNWMDEWYKQGLIDYEYYLEQRKEVTKKYAEAEKQAWEDALNAQIDSLSEKTDAYETMFNYIVTQIDKQIEALQEQRDAEEEAWDAKIQAVQDANDKLEEQISLEEKLDALARARQTQQLVYKDGRYQYVQDIDEVSAAAEDLDTYYREQAFNEQIENLEALKQAALDLIDSQIEDWEDYKEAWSSVVDNYQEEQDRLIAEEVLGIKLENDNWMTRLDNLQQFVNEYTSLMTQLSEAQATLNAGYAASTGGTSGGGGGGAGGGGIISTDYDPNVDYSTLMANSESWDEFQYWANKRENKAQAEGIDISGSGDYKSNEQIKQEWQASGKKKYASGTLSASGGLTMLGENGPELGVLPAGAGVLPADITKNLWAWGTTTPADMLTSLAGFNVSNGAGSNDIYIGELYLPNITDGESFVNYMRNNSMSLAVQHASKR